MPRKANMLNARAYIEYVVATIDINRQASDDRLENLREATCSENNINKPRRNNKTGYAGVYLSKGRYWAGIQKARKRKRKGPFTSVLEAHEAYKTLVVELHGEFAYKA